ncbi:MAG TPA: ABC transporter ATP-binding protein [Hyphomicrobiaceae bacterium]|jgi:putative ABC transport system ATP-binding protein|nr:ABC transporter ATP-binding protein [Hyphomicrobiaceae bacterium]
MIVPAVVEGFDIVKDFRQGATKVRALDSVTLTLNAGELTLLMGPSGSGKTTLLSILGCILTGTSGTVRIAGETVDGLEPERLASLRRRHVGFIFQSYNLFPTLTALENVQIALDVRGLRWVDIVAKAEAALDEVGLMHKLQSYPRSLSAGEQQRVAIARALAGAPSVILADEPTAALDSENGHAVMAVLAKIARSKGRAVLAVTHDPRTQAFADRIIHIEDGRIVGEECRTQANDNLAQPPSTRKHADHT